MELLRDSNLQIILAVMVTAVLGGSLIGPVLPAMTDPLNVGKENIGWVLSIYTLFAVLFIPVLGGLADQVGRKKVLVPSTILYGLAGTSIAFTETFELVLLFRALQGIGVAGMMNLGVILIGDLFDGVNRSTAMGYRTTAQSLTNTIIPFLAGTIATVYWGFPFLIYALAIPVGIYAYFRLDVPWVKNQKETMEYVKSILKIIKHPKSLSVFLSNLWLFILLYCLMIYFPLLLDEKFMLSTFYAGLAISFASGVVALTGTQAGKIMSRFPKRKIVLAGFTFCAIALFLIPYAPNFVLSLPVLFIWGIGFGLTIPTLSTLATELAPLEQRAGVVSGFSVMTYVGQTISPPLFAAVMTFTSLEFVFTAASMLALLPVLGIIISIILIK